jgi:predicted ATP-binding protein involved in virulence
MNPTATLRLDRVQVRNFRCFAECEVELHPKLTVIVAENGQGKSAILEAIAAGLGPVLSAICGMDVWPGLVPSDARMVKSESGHMHTSGVTEVRMSAAVLGESATWANALGRHRSPGRGSSANQPSAEIRRRAQAANAETKSELPLIAYYGTARLWTDSVESRSGGRVRRSSAQPGRLAAYSECLAPRATFRGLDDWYRSMVVSIESGWSRARPTEEDPVRLLAAVRRAVRIVLRPTGWRDLDYPQRAYVFGDGSPGLYDFVAEHPTHGYLPLSHLSDGVKNMMALVADIAHRCAILNPQFGAAAAERTPGVLLIDEVDMHLHPGWQQQVVGLLQEAFPALQIVVTTHSPQVLTTVEAANIRILNVAQGVGDLQTPTVQTMGVESADVLARIMGVDGIPDVEAARKLSKYKALIQQGSADSDEGDALREFLIEHFGAHHPLIVECRRLLRLQELKARPPAGGQN